MERVLQAVQEQQQQRPVNRFTLGPKMRALGDPYIKQSVGLVKLTFQQEVEAAEIAKGGSQMRAGFYVLVQSLVEVDGRRINKGDGEDERILNNTDPAIRDLIASAHRSLTNASVEEEQLFIESREVVV